VATLVDENLAPGTYQTQFTGEGLPSGTYVCRLTANGHSLTKHMVLTK